MLLRQCKVLPYAKVQKNGEMNFMNSQARKNAEDFLNLEKQFHLGFLPTEQSNPLTVNLDKEFEHGSVFGVKNLQSADRNVLVMAKRVLASEKFRKLSNSIYNTITAGGKVVFSGCGATGRLSILLESMYRECCEKNPALAQYSNNVFSIMTGGDYAMVRAVEFFEDYQSFGRQQVKELNMQSGDMLVAITEGGETSSVLGTLFEALDRGCKGFLLFNNPAELLAERLERSRKAITDERVCVLDLSCGPMALAGSTRMQATTSEQLIAGAALESAVCRLLDCPAPDHAVLFEELLNELESEKSVQAIADYIEFEADCCGNGNLLTYFANDYLLDIFTDTTERTPTFKLPPFRKSDDTTSARPWAFVKNPLYPTGELWEKCFRRPLRCLEWSEELYVAMEAPENVRNNPPLINASELLKFPVGSEMVEDRIVSDKDAAVLVTLSSGDDNAALLKAFDEVKTLFPIVKKLSIGTGAGDFTVECNLMKSPLDLMSHMAVKLVLNTASTGIMVRLGRVTGNWMSFVDVTNKKLIDRAIRLISSIGNMSYEESCYKLFEAVEILKDMPDNSPEKMPVVQYVLKKLGR